ncbi:translesion DNA synthesis-associated protein ImuA [Chitinivorax sp. PXF-14]|uniref:translesion DNA synthesis-associated protein ImuA n=1 Tax=Chitinivorax sp. PXF-14 TaxID=3230488 RepID=UPI003466CECC
MSTPLAALLSHPAIRRGDSVSLASHATASSGFPLLDSALPHGGWPVGAVSEVLYPQPGSGEWTLLLPLMARLTQVRQAVFLIAPPGIPYAPSLAAAGVGLEWLTWLAPRDENETLWAFEQVTREPCGAVLSWLPRSPPDKRCRRLQLAAEQGRCVAIMLRPDRGIHDGTPFGLRLAVRPLVDAIAVDVLKRRGPPLSSPILIRRKHDVVASLVPTAPAAGRVQPRPVPA